MTSISIIARNNCLLNVNVIGNYNVALTGVTGPYNLILLKPGRDFIRIKTHVDTRLMNYEDRKKAWENYILQLKQDSEKNKDLITSSEAKLAEINKAGNANDYKLPTDNKEFIQETGGEVSSFEYIKYQQEWKCYVKSEVVASYTASSVISLVNDLFYTAKKPHTTWTNLIDYIDSYSKFKFTNIDILDCSPAFGYLLGIPPGKEITGYSETIPVFNGTPYIFLKCNKLKTALRYCWQTDPSFKDLKEDEKYKKMYSNVQRIISVSPNNNYINNPFSLGGGQFVADGNDLTDVIFTITGINGEELEFASDLLWTFELAPIPDEDLSSLPGLLGQQQQEQEQQQQMPEGQPQEEQPQQQMEQQIVKPSSDSLMRNGLPRVEPIK